MFLVADTSVETRAKFGAWIVGPVAGVYHVSETDLSIVMQAHNAWAIVRSATCEYLGCAPTLDKAMAGARRIAAG